TVVARAALVNGLSADANRQARFEHAIRAALERPVSRRRDRQTSELRAAGRERRRGADAAARADAGTCDDVELPTRQLLAALRVHEHDGTADRRHDRD